MKLDGITVLDFTQFMAGPMVSSMMADHGARVIKVESPEGDPTRRGPRSRPGQDMGDSFRVLNRGKQSVVLDLKQPAHREAAQRLIRGADVVVEAFRPGVADRLGIGYADACALRPDIVYASLSAFGQSGLLKDVAAHDTMVQALAGTFAFDAEGRPVEPTVSLAAVAAAQFALSAILMALLAARSGRGGDHIDISMHDAALAIRGGMTAAALAAREQPQHFASPSASALAESYRTADGHWLRIDARDPRAARGLLEALQHPGLLALAPGSPDAAQQPLRRALADIFESDTLAGWLHRLGAEAGIVPVLNYAEALAHPHTTSRNIVGADADGAPHLGSPMRFAHDTARPGFEAPALGQHTRQVLMAAGYSEAELAAVVCP
jgi:crotonobetainyl-CoA:carnitine CoA-transferase CaiB-like acyl-CoA transferase